MANFMTYDSLTQTNLAPIVNMCRKSAKNITGTKFNIKDILRDSRKNVSAAYKDKRMAWLKTNAATITPAE